MPGVPPVPNMADLLRAMQVQAEVLTDLPETVADLNRVVRGLAETIDVTKATATSANRVIERLEVLLDDLQDPVQGLRPGLERINEVLNSPVVARIPAILESVERTVNPLAEASDRMRQRVDRLSQLYARSRRRIGTRPARGDRVDRQQQQRVEPQQGPSHHAP